MCKKDIEKQNYKDEMFIAMKKRGYTTQEIKYTMKLDFYMKSAKDLDCDSNTKKTVMKGN